MKPGLEKTEQCYHKIKGVREIIAWLRTPIHRGPTWVTPNYPYLKKLRTLAITNQKSV